MSVMRFDPFREMATLQDRVNRIFADAYTRRDDDVMSRGAWVPPGPSKCAVPDRSAGNCARTAATS